MLFVLLLILFLIFSYGYFLYPLVLLLVVGFYKNRNLVTRNFNGVGCSIIISIKNEEHNILNKLHDLFSLNIPNLDFEVIVVSDGSTDNTARILNKLNSNKVIFIRSDSNNGKPISLGTAISISRYNFVVFADARQTFHKDAILQLLSSLALSSVHCVSGQLCPKESSEGIGVGVDLYWSIEKFVRQAESSIYSSIGCTGAIYAMRKSRFSPIPFDTLLDDVIIPMKSIYPDGRIQYNVKSIAFDSQKLGGESEIRRKTRTIGGNFQMLFRYPEFFVHPIPIVSFFYFSHKVARLISPFVMIIMLLIPLFFVNITIYCTAFILVSITFCFVTRFRIPIISKISGFVFLNIMVFRGFYYYIKGNYRKGW